MPRVVHKAQFNKDLEPITIKTAANAFRVLHAEEQLDLPTFWYEDFPEAPNLKERTFIIIATGQRIPDKATHVGSCKCEPFMWHIYQVYE